MRNKSPLLLVNVHFQREINIVNPAPLLMSQPSGAQFSLQNHYLQKKTKTNATVVAFSLFAFWILSNLVWDKFSSFFYLPKWLETWKKTWFSVMWPAPRLEFSAHSHVHSNTIVPVGTDANPSHVFPLECPCCLAALCCCCLGGDSRWGHGVGAAQVLSYVFFR